MVPSSCQGVLESDNMAIYREILEAVHGNNNDNTLMVITPKAMFFFWSILLATCLVAASAAGNLRRTYLPFIMRHFFL